MIGLKPNVSVSKAVQYIKGGSSKVIRKEFLELREFLWGDNFWSEGYFAETVGVVSEKRIREYIRNQ